MGKKHSKPEDGALIIHLHVKQGKTKTEICVETGYGEKTVRITIITALSLDFNASDPFRTQK